MTSRTLILFAAVLAVSSTALAGEKEQQLIDKVTQAYGGDALTNMENYTLVDHYLRPIDGQSHSPELMEISDSKQILTVDIANNRASLDNWGNGRSGSSQYLTISDGEQAYTINYRAGTLWTGTKRRSTCFRRRCNEILRHSTCV